MKLLKTITFILAFAMLACCFVACSGNNGGESDTTGAAISNEKTTISFKIKDLDGKVLYEETNYVLIGSGYNLVTAIEEYMFIEHDNAKFEKEGDEIKTIGKASADDTSYWVYHDGTATSEKYIYSPMKDKVVEDGYAFTVILVKAKTE